MRERYTEKARRTIFFARYEASQFGSAFIETEHLLLGLLREDHRVLPKLPREQIRREIESRVPRRELIATSVDLPLSKACKRILAYGAEESESLQHAYIDTRHLALALLREEGVAREVLEAHGVRYDALRAGIARLPPPADVSRTYDLG